MHNSKINHLFKLLSSVHFKEDVTCRNRAVQTPTWPYMATAGVFGDFWAQGQRGWCCVSLFALWGHGEKTCFLYDLRGASSHCQRLSRIHCASTHWDTWRLKSWVEALLNMLFFSRPRCLWTESEYKKTRIELSISTDVTATPDCAIDDIQIHWLQSAWGQNVSASL